MKILIIRLDSGGYFNGFECGYIVTSPHPLNIKYFIYWDKPYMNDDLNRVKKELDEFGIKYEIMEYTYEVHEL